MNKKIKIIAFVILIIFSLIGLLVSGTLVHELSHKADFKEINLIDERVCILTFPKEGIIGFYEFKYHSKYSERVNKIEKYTEIKAYSLNSILIILFVTSFFIILNEILIILGDKNGYMSKM